MASSTIRIATKKRDPYKSRKTTSNKPSGFIKSKRGSVKTGMRLTGKTVVPNLLALKKKKIITSMD